MTNINVNEVKKIYCNECGINFMEISPLDPDYHNENIIYVCEECKPQEDNNENNEEDDIIDSDEAVAWISDLILHSPTSSENNTDTDSSWFFDWIGDLIPDISMPDIDISLPDIDFDIDL